MRRTAGVLTVAVLVLVTAGCGGGDPTADRSAPASPPPSSPIVPADEGGARTATGQAGADVAAAIRTLPAATSSPTLAPAGPQPAGLRIEALSIAQAEVVPVGVQANGDLEIPGASQVGWYRYGARPGQPGTTVLAGHIAFNGVTGVFARLADLAPGSVVEVVLDDGDVVSYQVTELTSYQKTALPFDAIFAPGGDPRLVLISCGGRFDRAARSYESNIVAYAVPAPSGP